MTRYRYNSASNQLSAQIQTDAGGNLVAELRTDGGGVTHACNAFGNNQYHSSVCAQPR